LIATKEETPTSNSKRAIVIFDTRYGNTERIARSFEAGLKLAGIVTTTCVNAKEVVNLESLNEYDLIAIGAPTEKITASETIKDFLSKLEGMDFSGKVGFAFDTKLPYPFTGSAAKFIERKLKNLGLEIVFERASAVVVPQKEEQSGIMLKDEQEKRFEEIGRQVGTALLTATSEDKKREVVAQ
jgi:flavorubredoxin